MKLVVVWVCAMNLNCSSKARLLYLGFTLASASFVSADNCHLFQEKLNGIFEWTNLNKWTNQQAYLIYRAAHTETHLYLIGQRLLQYLLTIKKWSSSLLSQRLWGLEPSPGGSTISLSETFLCSACLFLHSTPAFASSCYLAALCQLYWWDCFNTLTLKDQV